MKEIPQPLTDRVLEQLAAVLGQQVTFKQARGVGGGCIHHATRLETSVGVFFLKWNDRCASDLFLREAECLQELAKAVHPPLVIPKVYAAAAVDEMPGFLVMEFLEPDRNHAISDERLGEGLAWLHRYTADRFGFYHNNYCGATVQDNCWNTGWPDFFARQRIGFLVEKIRREGGFSPQELNVFEKLIFQIPSILPGKSAPALIHGDLWSGNYLLTENGPALIDPASCFSDREMEFGMITLFGGFSPRFFAAYQAANPLPAGWRERSRLYQLYHLLNHYLLFGGGYRTEAVSVARYFAGK